jgi:DNA-binding NarL/FixJ family response regulator
MNKCYKALIVDDHPIVVEGFKNLLGRLDFIEITATFTKGNSLFAYDELSTVDIIFMDIFLSDNNGIDLCAKLKKSHPKVIVLGVSSQSERSIVMQMINNGANGYMLKSASLNEIKRCLEEALAGKLTFCDEVTKMMDKLTVNDFKRIPRLTLREKEILQLLKEGKSTQEISDKLFLSYLTVQTHRRNLLAKFEVKNVIELLNFTNENGLL